MSCFLVGSEMGVDVLVTGHSHKLRVQQGPEGGLYINPGSVRYRSIALILCLFPICLNWCCLILFPFLLFIPFLSFAKATGCATVSDAVEPNASFVLLDVQGNKIVAYSYVLMKDGDQVRTPNAATKLHMA